MHIKKQKLNSVQGLSNAGQLAETGLFDLNGICTAAITGNSCPRK